MPHHPAAEPPGWLLIWVVRNSDTSGNVDGGTKEGTVASMCRVDLAGRIPAARVELIRSRFGDMSLRTSGERTVLKGPVADQSAVRALLNLLWDTGSDIRSLRVTTVDDPTRGRHDMEMPAYLDPNERRE
jgi:hypothetical protein